MEGGDEGVNSQLKRKIQDLEAMNEVFEKNEVELKDQIKGLNTTIKVQEERHSKIVQDFEALKINSIQNGSELVKLRKIIEYEREERKKVEGDAVQLLKRIKDEFEKRNQTQKDNYEQQITSLKEQLNQTQCKTINHETDYLNKEIKEHQDRIKELINSNMDLNQELRELKREIKETKLDLKMSQRDLSRSQEQMAYLRDRNRELRDKVAAFDLKVSNEIDNVKSKEEEIVKLTENFKSTETEQKAKLTHYQSEKVELEQQLKTLASQCEDLKQKDEEITKLKKQCEDKKLETDKLRMQFESVEISNRNMESEISKLKEELNKKDQTINKYTRINDALKSVTIEIERQADEYQSLNETQRLEIERLKDERNSLKFKLNQMENSMKICQEEVIKEKEALRDIKEYYDSEILHLQSEIKLQENNARSLEENTQMERENAVECERKLATYEYQLDSLEKALKDLSSHKDSVEEELISIKEEAAQHITQIGLLKSENRRLTYALEESLQKEETQQQSLQMALDNMESEALKSEKEILKLNETINQQRKAIDFLSSKNEEMEKTKKSWFSLTSPKRSQPQPKEQESSSKTNNVKQLEESLHKERLRTRKLTQNNDKLRSELLKYKADVLKLQEQAMARCGIETANAVRQCFQPVNRNLTQTFQKQSHSPKNKKSSDSDDENKPGLNDAAQFTAPSPSAPPPPYTSPEPDFSDCSITTDGNESETDNYPRKKVDKRNEQFSFTDSILEELNS